MTPEFSGQVELETASALMAKEGTTTIKEEAIATLEFSGQVELGTTSALTKKEAIVTPKLPSKEVQGTTINPKYSSRE